MHEAWERHVSVKNNKCFGVLQQVEANHNSRTHCDSNQLCTTRPLAMQLQAIAEQLQAFAKYGLRTVHNIEYCARVSSAKPLSRC